MSEYVFLSYTHKDREFLDKYRLFLKSKKFEIRYDGDMHAGESWNERAKRLIRNIDCKCAIFFISDNSIKSKPLLKELNYAVKYKVPYFAVILDGGNFESKFEDLRINHENDDVLDIAEAIMDLFPDEKIHIQHDESKMDDVVATLSNYLSATNSSKKRYQVIEGSEVTEDDIKKALMLDRKCYNIDDSEQFDIEKCLRWNKKTNCQIYTMIKDMESDDIVAYINAAPINDKCYEEIKSGKYADVNINDDDIERYDIPKEYSVYFASIVVNWENAKSNIFILLYGAFIEKLINLAKEGYIVSRLLADAVSAEGKKLCEKSGMKKIKDTEHDNSTIYELKLYPPNFSPISPKLRELKNILLEKQKILEEKK